jgi:hypothetical protein
MILSMCGVHPHGCLAYHERVHDQRRCPLSQNIEG